MNVEQRQQFKDNGFLIVKDVLSPATVANLNAIFVRLPPINLCCAQLHSPQQHA